MVTEPRMPCYRLGIKFGRSDIVKRFLASERTGCYFAVLQEGEVGVGDQIELIEGSKRRVKVSDITRLYTRESTTSDCFVAQLKSRLFPKAGGTIFSIDCRS
jgi:MOSC domain-containing protein YiiM